LQHVTYLLDKHVTVHVTVTEPDEDDSNCFLFSSFIKTKVLIEKKRSKLN
jgi:hypothetical protein